MFSCGIKVDETVECWGHMGSPEPGLFLQISAGEFHACGKGAAVVVLSQKKMTHSSSA
jgi:hypothetical protein